ncbi:alpha-amylase family glycosyl hydrolase [Sphaerotilus mobilis]|uniref:Alpha-glucosidase n=1 Tax=Sphaerotilus mobilis TaxID=47994 RepID=A0A4Q7LKS0_9BURK|nr:alpha-amylase family glycosyl hydrolase [Sphaerotilus mobilis]RZS54713.1 alpha-glucosidase [Sphaerotilus mobilis]
MTSISARTPRPPADLDWWRGAVIYQIYPRSFADANGDGIGDLAGITDRLPYVASLGVDAVWLSPIFRSPMKDFGYDVEDYRDIDPMFGTLADFDRLVAHAHHLGLKVIIDQVLSHTSDSHAWFQESRSSRDNARADWYVWADALPDGSPPNNWLSVFGGPAWQWDTRRKQYYLHNFLAAQPDLNLHHPDVQGQLMSDLRFWLDRGVDGFRFDTTNYLFHDRALRSNPALERAADVPLPANPYDHQQHLHDKNRPETEVFLEQVRRLLDAYGATSVGEVGDAEALDKMLAYTAGGKRLHMTYSFALLSRDHSVAHLRRHGEQFEAGARAPGQGGWPCWTLGNHDSTRLLTRWEGGQAPADFVRLKLVALLALRGSVCWYQGDELALPEAELRFEDLQDPPGIAFWPEYKGRDGCRTPMPWQHDAPHAGFGTDTGRRPWLPVPEAHRALAVDRHEADPDSPLHFMRAFLRWRRRQPALVRGPVEFIDTPEPALFVAIRRPEPGTAGDTLVLVLNFEATPVTLGCAALAPEHAAALQSAEAIAVPGLPARQAARRDGQALVVPGYGIHIALLRD